MKSVSPYSGYRNMTGQDIVPSSPTTTVAPEGCFDSKADRSKVEQVIANVVLSTDLLTLEDVDPPTTHSSKPIFSHEPIELGINLRSIFNN